CLSQEGAPPGRQSDVDRRLRRVWFEFAGNTFRPSVFSLIDRGFVYAIAHVRGGQEKGERWYAEGRMLNKRNTFTDFIAATEMLIAQGYADPRAVFAQGG